MIMDLTQTRQEPGVQAPSSQVRAVLSKIKGSIVSAELRFCLDR
jgi:hypothetical protein